MNDWRTYAVLGIMAATYACYALSKIYDRLGAILDQIHALPDDWDFFFNVKPRIQGKTWEQIQTEVEASRKATHQ